MSSPHVREITTRIAEVAKRTAIKHNPLVEGTVIGRNPDGSLVVRTSQGGCARVAPRANIRVGQRIVLGLEPALGRQTNLPEITVTLEPSTTPCPSDDRDDCESMIGVAPCPDPVSTSFALAANVFSVGWVDQHIIGAIYPGRNGDWKNRLGSGGDIAGGPLVGHLFIDPNKQVLLSVSRRSSSYASHFLPPYADNAPVGCTRFFLDFDTAGIPADARILEAVLRVSVVGNTEVRVRTDHSERLQVVPSTHDGTASTANWDKVEPFVLGEVAITDIIDAGPQPHADFDPYNIDIPLDAELTALFLNRAGRTKLALVNRLDSNPGSVLPTPGLFSTGRETTPTTPTPDDKVHVAAGSFAIDEVTYTSATPYDFQIDQRDGTGHLLTAGESYIAALVQPPGDSAAPVLVKGERSTTPRRPTIINEGPGGIVGGIILAWVTVACTQPNPSLISSSDIVEEPTSRPFTSVGNPNEIRSSVDRVLFTQTADVQLLLTYAPNAGLS